MLTKCKDVSRLDLEKRENKLFENVLCTVKGVLIIFFKGVEGEHILTYFPAELLRSKLRNKNSSREYGGMLPR